MTCQELRDDFEGDLRWPNRLSAVELVEPLRLPFLQSLCRRTERTGGTSSGRARLRAPIPDSLDNTVVTIIEVVLEQSRWLNRLPVMPNQPPHTLGWPHCVFAVAVAYGAMLLFIPGQHAWVRSTRYSAATHGRSSARGGPIGGGSGRIATAKRQSLVAVQPNTQTIRFACGKGQIASDKVQSLMFAIRSAVLARWSHSRAAAIAGDGLTPTSSGRMGPRFRQTFW